MLRLTHLFGIYKEVYEKIPPEKWNHEQLKKNIQNGEIPLYIVGKESDNLLLAADQFEVKKIYFLSEEFFVFNNFFKLSVLA